MPRVLSGSGRGRLTRSLVGASLIVASIGPATGAAGMPKIFTGLAGGAVLSYSTYFGGDNMIDNVTDVVVDADGNTFIAGSTEQPQNFPTTEGAYQTVGAGASDAFVAKFDSAGDLVWSTLFGGSGPEEGKTLGLTATGEVVLAGTTLSPDMATTPGALQNEFKGEIENCEFNCVGDAYVVSFAPDGSDIGFSTYLGGALGETASALELDEQGNIYLTGFTSSPDFPATQGAYDTDYDDPTCFDLCDADVFVAQLNPVASQLRFATFFGGTSWDSAEGLAVDAAGNIYVAGATRSTDLDTTEGAFQPEKNGNGDFDFNAFTASFNPDASGLRYATYLGAQDEEQATALAVTPEGAAWVTGWTHSRMPVTDDGMWTRRSGQGDAFVIALSRDGSSVDYGTYFGGSAFDSARGILVDADAVTLFGSSGSSDLPTRRSFQANTGGLDDLFLMRFVPGAERPRFSTYMGGEGFETASSIATHEGAVYLVGGTESKGLPLAGRFFSPDRGGNDGFLMRVDEGVSAGLTIRADGFDVRRINTAAVDGNVRWRNATARTRTLAESSVDLFAVSLRKGARYHFTFPSGRFVVTDERSGDSHRVNVAPVAAYGIEPGTIELRWATMPLGGGLVFDVQMKTGEAAYETLFDATTEVEAVLNEPMGNYRFRARVRDRDTGATSRWSPPALLSPPS